MREPQIDLKPKQRKHRQNASNKINKKTARDLTKVMVMIVAMIYVSTYTFWSYYVYQCENFQ